MGPKHQENTCPNSAYSVWRSCQKSAAVVEAEATRHSQWECVFPEVCSAEKKGVGNPGLRLLMEPSKEDKGAKPV